MSTIKSLTFILLWLAFAPAADAQYSCTIPAPAVVKDTQFVSPSISCQGLSCTAATTGESVSKFQEKVYFKRSNDGGKTWITQDPGLSDHYALDRRLHKVQQIDSLNVVAVGDSGMVIRTFDAGRTWQSQTLPLEALHPADVNFVNANEGMIALETIFTTEDGGAHWKAAKFKPPYLTACRAYGNGKFKAMSDGDGKIYSTSDNWITVDSTLPAVATLPNYDRIVGACQFGKGDTLIEYGNTILPAYPVGSRAFPLIIRSTNGGRSWLPAFADTLIMRGTVFSISSIDRDTIVAGCSMGQSTILRSIDRGKSWKYDTLLFETSFNPLSAFAVDLNSRGDLVASMGVLNTSLVHGQALKNEAVDTYSHIPYYSYLYPNPVSESLYIVSQDRSQPIFVYDMLGREVERGMLDANGKCTLNVSKLAPSIYVVMLQHDGQLLPVSRVAISR